MTYIYVKKDLTYIQDPASQSLLKAFLKAVYDDEYIVQCEKEFGFVRVGGALREMALNSIDALVTDPSAPEWTFEVDTAKRTGQGDYVISQKRKSYSEIEQDKLVEMIGKLSDKIGALEAKNLELSNSVPVASPHLHTPSSETAKTTTTDAFVLVDDGMDADSQVQAALIMSTVSIALWVAAILGMIVKHATGAGTKTNAGGVEKKPEDVMGNPTV